MIENSSNQEQEAVVAEWAEPETLSAIDPNLIRLGIIGSVAAALILIGIGYWQKDFTFYLSAAVAASAGLVIATQKRNKHVPQEVTLTNFRLQNGKSATLLTDLAGFWLTRESAYIAVNFEPAKASLMPITLLYPDLNEEELRDTLLQVLPEVAPRKSLISDNLNKYIRL